MHNASAQAADSRLVLRLFLRLLPVQILLVAVSSVNGIVSGLFASNYVGAAAVSAMNLYSPISLLLSAISTMLVIGSQALCGKYMGRNQLERTQEIFALDMLLTTGLSAIATVFLVIGACTGLSRAMTRDASMLAILNPYILGQTIGILPMLLSQQILAFLSLENQSRRTTLASVILAFVNLALNYLFVVVMKLGAFGLALASSLGMWVFFGIQAQYYVGGRSLLKLSRFRPERRGTVEIIKTGYQGAVAMGCLAVRTGIVNALVAKYVGMSGLSALGASGSVLGIFWAIPNGAINTARMLISISIGEEDRRSLVNSMRAALWVGILLMCVFSALLIALAEPLTRLFFQDPSEAVYGMTVMALRIMPLCMPFSICSLLFVCYGQIADRQKQVQLLSVLDHGVNVAVFTALLLPLMGMNGAYVANVCNGVVCVMTVILLSWIARRQFPRSVEQLMVIPDDFGAEEDARIDITVRQMAEVTSVSRMVDAFCRRRGIDERRTFYAALSLEEMAGNVVEHGFHKDDKPHSVDIRVVHKDDKVILRIRDDCKPFDPAERMRMMEPKDPASGVGIRLVTGVARDIQYQNLLGLNVLTILI